MDTKLQKIIVLVAALGFPIGFLTWKSCSSDWLTGIMTAYLALLTAYIIYWQGQQLRKQLELQVLTELYKEWNSVEMRKARAAFDKDADTDEALNNTEYILEYLERIASYYKNHVLSRDLIWDTIGWHVMRYYHYNIDNFIKIRGMWEDTTLYADSKDLYDDLVKKELKQRKLSKTAFNKELDKQYSLFVKSEK